jgi:hypothetical protein
MSEAEVAAIRETQRRADDHAFVASADDRGDASDNDDDVIIIMDGVTNTAHLNEQGRIGGCDR